MALFEVLCTSCSTLPHSSEGLHNATANGGHGTYSNACTTGSQNLYVPRKYIYIYISEIFRYSLSRFHPQVINCTVHTVGFGSPCEEMSTETTEDVNTVVCKRTMRILYSDILLDFSRAVVHFSGRVISNFGDRKIRSSLHITRRLTDS